MFQHAEQVALTTDLPTYELKAGDVGTIIDITPNHQLYTVEFYTLSGKTYAVVSLSPRRLRRVGDQDIAHARSFE